MRTVYMFYLIGNSINESKFPAINSDEVITNGNLQIYPYAWTADKSYRKQFKNIRDMSKFYENTIDVENFESFANSNSDTLLEFRRFNTKTIKNKIINESSIRILSTLREVNYVSMNINDILYSIISENLYNDCVDFIQPHLYKKEFKSSLKSLSIDDISFEIKNMNDSFESLPFSLKTLDSLNIYITAFANTYKK